MRLLMRDERASSTGKVRGAAKRLFLTGAFFYFFLFFF